MNGGRSIAKKKYISKSFVEEGGHGRRSEVDVLRGDRAASLAYQ